MRGDLTDQNLLISEVGVERHQRDSLRSNSIWSLVRWLWPSIISLSVTPILVQKLGGERYGILIITSSMVSLVGFVGVGFNDALIKFLSQARALGDRAACARIIRTNLFIFAISFGVVTLLSVIVAPWSVEHVIRPSPEIYGAARWTVVITGINFGLSLVAGSLTATMAAAERYDFVAVLGITLSSLLGIGQVAIAVLFQDIVLLSLWSIVNTSLILAVSALLFRRIFSAVSLVPRPFGDAIMKLSKFSIYRVLDAVFALAYFQFDRVLIGVLTQVNNLMYYSVPATVSQMIGHGANVLTMPLVPRVSALQATNRWSDIRELYLRATKLASWVIVTAVVVLVVLAGPLIRAWLGGPFANRSSLLLQWLVVAWGVLALGFVATNTLFGLGVPKVNAACRFLQSLGGLGGIALWVPTYGIVAAGWGLLIGNVASVFGLLIYTERVLRMRPGTTLAHGLLQPFAIGLALLLAAKVLAPLTKDLLSIILIVGALVVLSMILAILSNVIGGADLATVKERALGSLRIQTDRPSRTGKH